MGEINSGIKINRQVLGACWIVRTCPSIRGNMQYFGQWGEIIAVNIYQVLAKCQPLHMLSVL